MKKIMFNDKYGLTAAVLNGKKTMTRRIVKNVNILQFLNELADDGAIRTIKGPILSVENSAYKVGEIVAVAQAYKHIVDNHYFQEQCLANGTDAVLTRFDAGWDNKMFVKSYYMPHRIRITAIKAERLQDINEEDCLYEGVLKWKRGLNLYFYEGQSEPDYDTPREAFAALIDKVSGKGTWESNPWVFVYSFELID